MKKKCLLKEYDALLANPINEKVIPSINTKGVLLYAVPTGTSPFCGGVNDWVLLVDKLVPSIYEDGEFYVATHASYSFSHHVFFIKPDLEKTFFWGGTSNYDFYLLSKTQKKFFIEQLRSCGYKFIKAINKLVER